MGDMAFIFDNDPITIPFVLTEAVSMELPAESEHIEGVVVL